jgi:WD40 repeat protein
VTQATVPAQRTRPLPQSPYKGLLAYTAEDVEFFFGREVERELIAAHLMAAKLTVLYGPSGVGKTSVLDAGVTPDLAEFARETVEEGDTPRRVLVVFRTWRGDPAAGLAEAVAQSVRGLLPDQDFDDPSPDANLVDMLAHWSRKLGGRLLIVLDQFEEYFVYASAGDRFDAEFPRAVNRSDLRANFVISIREDALAKLDRFKGRIPYLFDNYLRLDRLDLGAARLAIEGPLRRWAELGGGVVSVDEKLVAQVLEEVRPDLGFGQAGTGTADADAERPDRIETTFLQLVMTKLWETERAAGSKVLRVSTLNDLGGAKGIVRARLNEGLDLLTPAEKDVAAHVFQFLVTRSGQKVAHTAVDLADFSGEPLRAVTEVLERLSRRDVWILRRVDPAVGEKETGSLYEIYHDTLGEPILAWRSAHLQRMNERKANERARDARRRARLWAIGAATMLAVAAACLALLFVALHARSTADAARKVARAQQLVAESEANLPTDPDGALRKAEQALEVKPSPQAEFAFRTAFGASQLRVAIRHSNGAMLSAEYSGNGSRVMAVGTDKTVSVSEASTGRLISSIGYHITLLNADFSRNGKVVVTAGRDDTVRFWNASTGALLAKFHNPHLVGAWLDPANSRRAVAVGSDGGLRIWRLGRRPLVLRGHGIPLTKAAFSPNGRMIAAIGLSPKTWLFDARTGELRHELGGHIANVDALAWSPGSRYLVTGGNDSRWRTWNAATGAGLVGNDDTGPITAVAFSPTQRLVATVTGSQVSVWETQYATRVARLQGHSGLVTDVGFSPDGFLLLTSSADGTARVWNLETQTTLMELRGNAGAVSTAVFSPKGKFVLTASDDRAARIWYVGTGRALWVHNSAVTDARFARGGKVVLTGGTDGQFVVSPLGKGEPFSPTAVPDEPVHSIRLSRDGKLLAVATDNPALVVRRASNSEPIATLKGNPSGVAEAVFNPKGTEIAVGDTDGSAGIFNARTGNLIRWLSAGGHQRAHPLGRVTGIDWSRDGRYIVTAGTDSQVRVWNAGTGQYLRTLSRHNGSVTSVAFAPSGDRIIATGLDRTAIVWDVRSRKPLAVLQGDPQPLYSAAFSPGGGWVVTGDSGGVVRVWDWRAKKMLAAIPAHAGPVNAVSFSPDGKRILSASDDWSAKIYRCTACKPLRVLRYRVYKRERRIGS